MAEWAEEKPMDLDVRHLQLVDAVAAHGSLTKAGERLNLTQSAVSRGE